MNDFSNAVYDRDLRIDGGVHLIEASAGTGKTYNIQNIYARLVMETDFRVSNILVMTFTEAATQELRERLRAILLDLQKRLKDSPENCDGDDPEDVERRNSRADNLIACANGERRTKRLRVELAIGEFDNAAISTIHGFCERVLKRYAFEIGIPLAKEIKNTKAAELGARAEDWWRKNGSPANEEFLGKLKKTVVKLGGKADYRIVGESDLLKVAEAQFF